MVMSTQDRIALLAKAREAKRLKKAEADALKPIPIKGRPKKNHDEKTLNLVDKLEVNDEEVEEIIEPVKSPKRTKKKISFNYEPDVETSSHSKKIEDEIEPEIIEEVVVKKIRKPKKRIVRKIIQEQYDSDSTEEEYEEVVYKAPKQKSRQSKVKEVTENLQPTELTPPREPEIKKPTFNLFSY